MSVAEIGINPDSRRPTAQQIGDAAARAGIAVVNISPTSSMTR
jgi:hypothetical protein